MSSLKQEVLVFSHLVVDRGMTIRACKRFVNVLTLFQVITASLSPITSFAFLFSKLWSIFLQLASGVLICFPLSSVLQRAKKQDKRLWIGSFPNQYAYQWVLIKKLLWSLFCFVLNTACVLNFVVPLILFDVPLEIYDNVRAVDLSMVGILCQVLALRTLSLDNLSSYRTSFIFSKFFHFVLKAREPEFIRWALESNMVEVCWISIEIGIELYKMVQLPFLCYMLMFLISFLIVHHTVEWDTDWLRVIQLVACFEPRIGMSAGSLN